VRILRSISGSSALAFAHTLVTIAKSLPPVTSSGFCRPRNQCRFRKVAQADELESGSAGDSASVPARLIAPDDTTVEDQNRKMSRIRVCFQDSPAFGH